MKKIYLENHKNDKVLLMTKFATYSFYIILFCGLLLPVNAKIMLNENDILTMPLPKPYDGKVYTVNDLNGFVNNAIKNSKQPILIFGANWCPDCRIFSGTMSIPKINSYIQDNYEILYIDVKRYEINMDLMEEYGIEPAEGIPRILVFDKNKNLLNSSRTTEWRTARDRTSQEIFNFFQDMKTN